MATMTSAAFFTLIGFAVGASVALLSVAVYLGRLIRQIDADLDEQEPEEH